MPANFHKNLEGQVCLESSQKGTRDGNTFPSVNISNFFVLAEKERHCHIEVLSIKSLSSRFWTNGPAQNPEAFPHVHFFQTSLPSVFSKKWRKKGSGQFPPSLCSKIPRYPLNLVFIALTVFQVRQLQPSQLTYTYSIVRFMSVF